MLSLLHLHSYFSFHAGVDSPEELARMAAHYGATACALADTNRMSGLIRFYLACKNHGIKPLLGVSLCQPKTGSDGWPDVLNSVTLLARNAEGYGDICELITKRQLQSESFCIQRELQRPWPNVLILCASPALLRHLARTPNRKRLFAQIDLLTKAGRARTTELERCASEHALTCYAGSPLWLSSFKQHATHCTLRAIGENATLSRMRADEFCHPDQSMEYFCTKAAALYPQQLLKNSAAIARACTVDLQLGSWIMPRIHSVRGKSPQRHLAEQALRGLHNRYGNTPEFKRARTIQHKELQVINRLGYASYFLMVKKIYDYATATLARGYRKATDCVILRGSAANAITFYNLGVSRLDPIEHDLYFERFLNEDRASPPDADLDFGWDERDKILQFVTDEFGSDRVAITCTTNHFRRRAAFRETAKVHGYSEQQVTTILDSFKTQSRQLCDDHITAIQSLADTIVGKPRFLGQHPGGLLITNQPIWRHVGCEFSRSSGGRQITQVDMHSGIDELGLIKFDLLGNGSLSVLRDVLKQLEEQHLADPGIDDLQRCFADPKVRSMLRNGRTMGIFYIESPAQSRLNQKAQAETFEEITVTSSLVRPAGTEYTDTYVQRHRKSKLGIYDWQFLHPTLRPLLNATHDVCAFQEDITKICHHVAGLSYAQADKIRKMMNSLHEGMLEDEEYKQTACDFMRGCMHTSGFTRTQARTLWQRVSSFKGFSFCKSHSASYAQLSFQCAYLKAHYPAQFIAAVISNNHGFYRRDIYIDEARRLGITILPLHINLSSDCYIGKHRWIRCGFMHVRNLSTSTRQNIIAERRSAGAFCNLADFVQRTPASRSETENLILLGAFDCFGLSQPQLLFLLHELFENTHHNTPSFLPAAQQTDPLPELPPYSLMQRSLHELQLMGFMYSADLLCILDLHPAARKACAICDLDKKVDTVITIFGKPVTQRLHRIEHRKELMSFVTIADKSGMVDVIFWPETQRRFADTLLLPGPFLIRGTVQNDYGTTTVIAQDLQHVEWHAAVVDFDRASKRLHQQTHTSFSPSKELSHGYAA